jgi:hypothetical protein
MSRRRVEKGRRIFVRRMLAPVVLMLGAGRSPGAERVHPDMPARGWSPELPAPAPVRDREGDERGHHHEPR